ncbi:hypothetical protein [Streptomyces sp. KL116D]|uniref:hypothetical protein n=1 Tax=Streptomyces sp. KL116D TaxID=3045152 RepID=UPI003558A04F
MIAVAVLLLPTLALILFGLDRIEDRMFHPARPPAPGHARRRRHLRLITNPVQNNQPDESRHRRDAA